MFKSLFRKNVRCTFFDTVNIKPELEIPLLCYQATLVYEKIKMNYILKYLTQFPPAASAPGLCCQSVADI
jgi:hypothetical protein